MKIKLVTFMLNEIDELKLKNVKRKLFLKTNDPSFNILPPFVILGQTQLNNFNNLHIDFSNKPIIFSKDISNTDLTSFIQAESNVCCDSLFAQLCFNNTTFNSKYLNLLNNNFKNPYILLGNKTDLLIHFDKIVLKDYRLKLIEIEEKNNNIFYEQLDFIHLSLDKTN